MTDPTELSLRERRVLEGFEARAVADDSHLDAWLRDGLSTERRRLRRLLLVATNLVAAGLAGHIAAVVTGPPASGPLLASAGVAVCLGATLAVAVAARLFHLVDWCPTDRGGSDA